MSPEAYLQSLQRAADLAKMEQGKWILDAGCGSGLLLDYLESWLEKEGRYLGMDILPTGLASAKSRIQSFKPNSFAGVQADLSRKFPLADASISCAIAHFSVYTLSSKNARKQVYRELWRVLEPGGLLITANPAYSYDADRIIRSSLEQLQNHGRSWKVKKYMLYPLTLRLGLRYIEHQLRSGKWHGYLPGELQEEVEQADFLMEHSEEVYGGSGFLVTGRKKEN